MSLAGDNAGVDKRILPSNLISLRSNRSAPLRDLTLMENASNTPSAAYAVGLSVGTLQAVFRGKHISAAIIVLIGAILLLGGACLTRGETGLFIQIVGCIVCGVGLTGWIFSTQILNVDSYYCWHYSRAFVTAFDVFQGIIKSVLFGGAVAVISCHRGFHSGAGAEGVGRAATEAFVFSFVTILVIDFLVGTFLMEVYFLIFPRTYSMG